MLCHSPRRVVWSLLLLCSFAGSALVGPVLTVRADDLRSTSMLGLLPENTSFYTGMLRGGDQWKRFANSNWVKQYLALPSVKKLIEQGKEQFNQADNQQLEIAKLLWSLPENQELVKLLGDAASHEVFIAGGKSWPGLMQLSRKLNQAQREGTLEMLKPFDPNENFEDRAAAPQRKMLDTIVDNLNSIVMPELMVGFRLSDPAPAERQFARLEAIVRAQLAEKPELNDRLKKETIAGGPFLVARFKGTEVPWDDFRQATPQIEGPQLDKLQKHVEKQTAVLAVGVCKGYILIYVGSSTDGIASLGTGKLLIDRPEFAPVRDNADKSFTGVSYVSTDFMQSMNQIEDTYEYFVNIAKMLTQVAEVPEAMVEDIDADIKAIFVRLKRMVETPQAIVSFNYFSPRGYEGYTYQYGAGKLVDGSKPLTVLDHVGGDPILVGAGRTSQQVEGLLLVRDFYAKYLYWVDQIVGLNIPEPERERYLKFRKGFVPVLERLDKAWCECLVPGLKDGQTALVIDANMTSKQWHPAMPAADVPLPMLEISLVQGVSDARLVRQAMDEFYECIRDGHKALIDIDENTPAEIREWKLPSPKIAETRFGTIASYPFPEMAQLDARFAFTGGLNEEVTVLTLSTDTATRLLTKQTLKIDSPLYKPGMPLAGLSHFNFAKLLDTAQPWIEYGIDHAPPVGAGGFGDLQLEPQDLKLDPAPFEERELKGIEDQPDFGPPNAAPAPPGIDAEGGPGIELKKKPAPKKPALPKKHVRLLGAGEQFVFAEPELPAVPKLTPAEMKEQVRTLFKFLKSYRGSTSVTYHGKDALVTRSEWHYEDLAPAK